MTHVITVWKDGTYKIWGVRDAHYAAQDPDWLVNITGDENMAEFGSQPLILKSSTDEVLSLCISWYRARVERLNTNPSDTNENYEFLEGEEERLEWKLAEAIAIGLREVPTRNPI